jgi:hypothetical protein
VKSRYAAALALTVWYLMVPPAFPGRTHVPLSENMPVEQQFDERAPLAQWSRVGSTATARAAVLPASASGMIRNR